MATKEDIMKRLMDAKQRAIESGEPFALAQVSECFYDLAAILAEQNARIEKMRQQIEVLTSHAHVHGVNP